ncbi:MAG: hypothetical protein ABSG92_10730 [Conexivisphaerales archaeon]|jgi:hypothetical protein
MSEARDSKPKETMKEKAKREYLYFKVGWWHIGLALPFFTFLPIFIVAKVPLVVSDLRNGTTFLLAAAGILIGFVWQSNLSLGIEFNRLLGKTDEAFVDQFWNEMRETLPSIYLNYGSLVVALFSNYFFLKGDTITSDNPLFLINVIIFGVLAEGLGRAALIHYNGLGSMKAAVVKNRKTEAFQYALDYLLRTSREKDPKKNWQMVEKFAEVLDGAFSGDEESQKKADEGEPTPKSEAKVDS